MSKQQIMGLAKVAGAFVVFWVLAFLYGANGCSKVPGNQMAPAVTSGMAWVEVGIDSTDQLEYDDIVLFDYTNRGNVRTTPARVVGLPGDLIRMEKGEVYRNDDKIPSNYISPAQLTKEDYEETMVPRGTVFLLCDSRRMGTKSDSRAVGPVGIWAITGRIR